MKIDSYTIEEWAQSEAEKTTLSLSADQKASQLIMTVIDGKDTLPAYFDRHFRDCVPGAVLLFRYNVADSPEAFHAFLAEAQRGFEKHGLPVIFAIDHEGGDVYRTGTVTTRLPSQLYVADNYSPSAAQNIYEAAALELNLLGITMNLAPVVEAGTGQNTDFLGTRVFSSERVAVLDYSIHAVQGIDRAGLISTVKHFPGNSKDDPHTGISKMTISLETFTDEVLPPFKDLLESKPGAVLVSHVIVESIDPGVPFCLSQKGVSAILRNELGYNGLIITDDLSMGAIQTSGFSTQNAAVKAIQAGCDLVMTSDPDIVSLKNAIIKEMERVPLFSTRVEESVIRILRAKLLSGLPVSQLGQEYLTMNAAIPPLDIELYKQARNRTERALELQ